jgi:hypothetical protein
LKEANISNGLAFVVGDGVQTATLNKLAAGSGTNLSFAKGLVINTNATLTGVGRVLATTDVYGALSPGSGIGVMTNMGGMTLKSSGRVVIEINTNTTPVAGWDLEVVEGTLTVGGEVKVVLTSAYRPASSATFLIMTNTAADTIGGSFSGTAAVHTNSNFALKSIGTFQIKVDPHAVILQNFAGTTKGTVITIL